MTNGRPTRIKTQTDWGPVFFGKWFGWGVKKARASQLSKPVPPNRAELLRRSASLGSKNTTAHFECPQSRSFVGRCQTRLFRLGGFLIKIKLRCGTKSRMQ